MMRIAKLFIKKFRLFAPDSVFEIGPRITLISGINGTAKSTLLGMICQPLGFPSKKKSDSAYTRAYDGHALQDKRTLFGSYFKAEFSDVFRLSKKFDSVRNHEYTLYLEGDAFAENSSVKEEGLKVRSEARNDQHDNKFRFVTNSQTRKPGEGNYPHPVIYLGLDRLRPLSTLQKEDVVNEGAKLSAEEDRIWNDIYKTVMITLKNEDVHSEEIDTGATFKYKYHSVATSFFDSESASAGQDNLGLIVTAIVSFAHLKSELGSAYQGGVLLIDELDATLHPIAQQLLLRKLVEYSEKLNLQIIATTHSLTLLEDACRKYKKYTTLIYLEKKDNVVKLHNDVDYDFILSDLIHYRKENKIQGPRTTVMFEDSVAADFFKKISQSVFGEYVTIHNAESHNSETCLPNDILAQIATRLSSKKIPEFENIVFVVDPDSRHLLSKKMRKLVALPGSGLSIEEEMYRFLFGLKEEDPLWTKYGVSQVQCFAGYTTIDEVANQNEKKRRYKEWLAHIKEIGCFGKNADKVYLEWRKTQGDLCRKFCEEFIDALIVAGNKAVEVQKAEILSKIGKKFEKKHRP